MLCRIFIPLLCWIVLSVEPAEAILVQGYNTDKHDRFAESVDFIGDAYDFSGVGRLSTGGRWATMISPSYFLSATHSHPGPTTTVRFFETNDMSGDFVDHTVDSGAAIDGSDLWLGKLSTPVDSSIAIYPILEPSYLIDQLIYAVGQDGSTGMRVGRNEVDEVLPDFQDDALGPAEGDVFIFDYDTVDGLGDDESRMQGGDSGGPSFAVIEGELAILGIHWFVYDVEEDDVVVERGSGDTLVSSFIPDLSSAIVGESLTTVAIPEPSQMLALGLLALGIATRRKLLRARSIS